MDYQTWLATLTEKHKNKVLREANKIHGLALLEEAGRTISNASAEKLSLALKSMSDAIATIGELIGSDGVKENNSIVEKLRVDEELNPIAAFIYDDGSGLVTEAGKILAQNDSFDSKRHMVSQALRQRAIAKMAQDKLSQLADGIGDDYYDDYYYPYNCMPHIVDLYDSDVVYRQEKELYQCSYTIANDVVTLDEPVPVNISYVPESDNVVESVDLAIKGELIELREKAVAPDGTVQIKLISPGWGSSGYYSEKMLQRDGPKVFGKGLHMYINHPTYEEDQNRPERDLKDLAGVLLSDAKYDKNGPTGPGLYAPAQVFENYSQFIDQAAPHIGTSIRASGKATDGEAEGRHGTIIEGLIEGYSVDYVTMPGRGGEVLPLLEAARTKMNKADDSQREKIETVEDEMTEEQIKALINSAVAEATSNTTKALTESQTEVARLREGLILRDARIIVESTLRGLDLPDMTRTRLMESCAKNPPVVDGALDTTALIESVKAAAIEEMKYISSVGGGSGKPVGVGKVEITTEEADKTLKEAFADMGMSANGIAVAVNGRS